MFFLGDESNRDVAKRHGWIHFNIDEFRSRKNEAFDAVFRHVQGKEHHHIKNSKDWLKYVFERWIFIGEFLKRQDIKDFWHFDSDTMVLHNLQEYEYLFDEYDNSEQCSGICLNGFSKTEVVDEYTDTIIDLFKDEEYLAGKQRIFDSEHPNWAFTEMAAYKTYTERVSRPRIYLRTISDNLTFDDALMNEHGFSMWRLPTGERIKDIYFENGRCYGFRNSKKVEFATLNLSWYRDYVFDWVLQSLSVPKSSVKSIQCPLGEYVWYMLQKAKKLFIPNVRVFNRRVVNRK
jgi:hypothetical protein